MLKAFWSHYPPSIYLLPCVSPGPLASEIHCEFFDEDIQKPLTDLYLSLTGIVLGVTGPVSVVLSSGSKLQDKRGPTLLLAHRIEQWIFCIAQRVYIWCRYRPFDLRTVHMYINAPPSYFYLAKNYFHPQRLVYGVW